jgi:hypothetical protein
MTLPNYPTLDPANWHYFHMLQGGVEFQHPKHNSFMKYYFASESKTGNGLNVVKRVLS